MALRHLLDITLSVPDPDALKNFWVRRGLIQGENGILGTKDRSRQICIEEGPYRHLSQLHLGCETEEDLYEIRGRLNDLGMTAVVRDTVLTVDDPIFDHITKVEVVGNNPLTGIEEPLCNFPGTSNRNSTRLNQSSIVTPPAPRRVGHIVLGTPHLELANKFFLEGLGYRVSDRIVVGDGEEKTPVGVFSRIENDHHNLLVHPAATTYLNHYALEMDNVDAIGLAGKAVVDEQPDSHVVGVGRHFLGSNLFWYMFDPAGNMFEFFADMDQITDDEAWAKETGRDWSPEETPVSVWGPKEPDVFYQPPDILDIARVREEMGLK